MHEMFHGTLAGRAPPQDHREVVRRHLDDLFECEARALRRRGHRLEIAHAPVGVAARAGSRRTPRCSARCARRRACRRRRDRARRRRRADAPAPRISPSVAAQGEMWIMLMHRIAASGLGMPASSSQSGAATSSASGGRTFATPAAAIHAAMLARCVRLGIARLEDEPGKLRGEPDRVLAGAARDLEHGAARRAARAAAPPRIGSRLRSAEGEDRRSSMCDPGE